MSFDEPRDFNGNVVTHHGSIKASMAGANPSDSAGTVDEKVRGMDAMNALARKGMLPPPSWASVAKAVAYLCVGFVVLVGIGLSYPWWKQLRDPAGMWERYSVSRSVADRREHFSDFAPVDAWPADVQKMVARSRDKSVDEIVAEIPTTRVLPQATRDEIGAALWFKLSAHGKETNSAFEDLRARTKKTKNGYLKTNEIWISQFNFLDRHCERGVEVACVDFAKVIASVTFRSIHERAVEKNVTGNALSQLPRSGPLASSPAIVDLRKKLEAYE